MTTKQIFTFLGSFIITSLIYLVLFYIIVMATFSLSGERLTEKENREAFFFYTAIFVTAITIYIIYDRYKNERKYSAAGVGIPVLFALYLCVQTGLVYAENLNYYQPFQEQIWKQSLSKPFHMAKTLVKSNTLTGKSSAQIIEQLGTPATSVNNNIKYSTDNDAWEMNLLLKNDKVVDVYLYQEGI